MGDSPKWVKSRRRRKKKERERERLNNGENNGQATHGAHKHAWRTQAAWAKIRRKNIHTVISSGMEPIENKIWKRRIRIKYLWVEWKLENNIRRKKFLILIKSSFTYLRWDQLLPGGPMLEHLIVMSMLIWLQLYKIEYCLLPAGWPLAISLNTCFVIMLMLIVVFHPLLPPCMSLPVFYNL